MDVSKWASQVQLFKFAVESVGRIDYVYANAGIIEPPWLPPASSITKLGDDFLEPDLGVISVNVNGTLYTANLAVQVFRRQELVDGIRGKLIVTASVASVSLSIHLCDVLTDSFCWARSCRGIYAMPQPLYCTSKHGLVGLVRAMALQHFSEGITVNGVAPNATRECNP